MGDENQRQVQGSSEKGQVIVAGAPKQQYPHGVQKVDPQGGLGPVIAENGRPDGRKGGPGQVDVVARVEVGEEVAILQLEQPEQ